MLFHIMQPRLIAIPHRTLDVILEQRETNPPSYEEAVVAVAESNTATPHTGRNQTSEERQFDDAQPVESCIEISVEDDTVVQSVKPST